MDNSATHNFGFLMHEVSRLMRRRLDQHFKPMGLTQAQWRALAHLSRNEGMNQTSLADLLEVRPITLARLIDRLETAHWVERRPDPADRRACRLYLTPKAQPLLDEMRALAQKVREQAMQGIPDNTREVLINSLCTMKDNLLDNEEKASLLSNEK